MVEAKRIVKIFAGSIVLAMLLSQCTEDADASQLWTTSTYALRDRMKEVGFSSNLATYVIYRCKATAYNPRHCVETATFIAKAESGCGKNAKNNNVWGMRTRSFASKEEAFERWLKSYNRFWHRTEGPVDFYPLRGQTSKTYYCTDERSSGSKVGCPNGRRIAEEAYLFIKK